MKILLLLTSVLALLLFACGSGDDAESAAMEGATPAADMVKVLFENNHLTVLKVTVPPQAELPAQKWESGILYSLSDYRLQYLKPDYPASLATHRKGEGEWQRASLFGVKNVGPITAEYLLVTSKGDNPTPGVTSNIAELSPDKARVVFENESAKVIEISLEPGDKQPVHNAASRAVYALTDAKLAFVAGGERTESTLTAGEVHYHAGGEHSVENLSDNPVQYLVFELM
jgi:quercetin dioxygenase-like cupin family protein